MRGAVLALIAIVAWGQEAAKTKFEVASVRHLKPDDDRRGKVSGGPGTSDPETIVMVSQTVSRFLVLAYGVDFDQIFGPDWIDSELYDVTAKVAPGTTKEQVRLMWQDLLAERFKLKAHIEKRPYEAYELSIAKSGPKLRAPGGAREPAVTTPPSGMKWGLKPALRDIKGYCRDCTMAEFISHIAWPLGEMSKAGGSATVGRIVDKTGLTGSYDFALEFSGAWSIGGAFVPPPEGQPDPAPMLIDALREQLGLQLKPVKTMLDALVIDHVEKIPTEN